MLREFLDRKIITTTVVGEFRVLTLKLDYITIAKGLVRSGDYNVETAIFMRCLKNLKPVESAEVVAMMSDMGKASFDVSLQLMSVLIPAVSRKRGSKRKRGVSAPHDEE
jgi:hypothetical protein